jgi:hypothetical protein
MTVKRLTPRLTDIIEAIERVRGVLGDMSLEAYEADWEKQWLVVNGGAIPGQRGGAKPGQLDEIADTQRGPIGPLCMSAAEKFVGYVGWISPVSGSVLRLAAG